MALRVGWINSDKLIDKVFDVFLAATDLSRFAVLVCHRAQRLQREAASRELFAFPTVERAVALLTYAQVFSIIEDCLSRQQCTCEAVHATDVCIEDIDKIG